MLTSLRSASSVDGHNNQAILLGVAALASILGASTIASMLTVENKPGKLQRQNSGKKVGEGEEDEADDSKEDPRPMVAEETLRLTRDKLMPLNQLVRGPLERRPDFRTPLPFVFILGNHSSGKSSFINFVLQRKIQEAGVAPTDDGFTIIAPGPEDREMDGPTLVGGDDIGFTGLRSFGSVLVEHVKMKLRNKMALNDIMMVDSPGMIDSPADSVNFNQLKEKKDDRGYDFEGVVRWMAQRADVILLFFDPDKPGTTGETLSVLTNALTNVDHKLLIVLNKADMFQRSADFARSYGALCWNLAKVIPRKDLPRIFTTYTPGTSNEGSMSISKEAKAELDTVRNELIGEIKLTPFRRMDNYITSLYDQSRLLKMHAEILSDVRNAYRAEKVKTVAYTVGGGLAGVAVLSAAISRDADAVSLGLAAGLSIVPAVLGMVYGLFKVRSKFNEFSSLEDEPLDELFRKRFKQEIAERDESTNGYWTRVRPQVKVAIEHFGLPKLPRVPQEQIVELDKILSVNVPFLRRKAAKRFARMN